MLREPTMNFQGQDPDVAPTETSTKATPNLSVLESKIDLKVLHHMTRDGKQRQDHFHETVMAVYDIVENKLYKGRSANLEQYFREFWKISRAQVYRFYNCARVLRDLDGFQVQPSRERLCRTIKRFAKNRQDRRLLWSEVLEKMSPDDLASNATSTTVKQAWEEILTKGLVTDALGSKDCDDTHDEDLANEKSPPPARQSRTGLQTAPATRGQAVSAPMPIIHMPRPAVLLSSDSSEFEVTALTLASLAEASELEEIRRIEQSIRRLADKGYELQPLLQGQWMSSINDWRFHRRVIDSASSSAFLFQVPSRQGSESSMNTLAEEAASLMEQQLQSRRDQPTRPRTHGVHPPSHRGAPYHVPSGAPYCHPPQNGTMAYHADPSVPHARQQQHQHQSLRPQEGDQMETPSQRADAADFADVRISPVSSSAPSETGA